MPRCEKCGREVNKLTVHAKTGKRLCLKCLTESGFFTLSDDDRISPTERRASIRIPLTVVMNFSLPHRKEKYPAYTVDISISGICFGWNACSACHGYTERAIDKDCILYPYYIHNPERKQLELELKVSDTVTIITAAYAVHTYKEENIDIEYVGAKFVNMNVQSRRMLEKLVIKTGKDFLG